MSIVSASKKILPRFLFSFVKFIYNDTSFWFTFYTLFSPRRVSSFRSCFSKTSEPLKIKADNVVYKIDGKDNLQRRICMSLYEKEDLKQVIDCFKESCGVFVDIGANIGYFSLNLAKNCSNCELVYAFEADPLVFKQLNQNVEENCLGDVVKTFNIAATREPGIVMFNQSLDAKCSGAGSLQKFSDIQTKQLSVTALSLDVFVKTHQIKNIICLKVDIEGNEIEFLKGAQETIQKGMIKNMLIEFNGPRLAELGVTFDEFQSYFRRDMYLCRYNSKLYDDLLLRRKDPKEFCANFLFSLRN